MKNLLTALVISTILVSCGYSKEEQEAIRALEARQTRLEFEIKLKKDEKDFWYDNFNEETNVDTKLAYADEGERCSNELEELESELLHIKTELAKF
jgi:hypothetical protein